MQNYQVINKIKKLESINPNKDWVISTKQDILGELDHSKVSTLDWFFIAFKKPVFVLSALLIVMIIGGGFLFSGLQGDQPEIADNSNGMLDSLQNLESKLEEISLSLDNLKNAENQKQALVMAGIIKSTANGIERGVEQIDSSKYEKQVLAVRNASEKVQEEAENKQKEMIEFLINDLKQRTLTGEDQERLEKLEQDYNNGEYDQAMIWIQMIGDNINNN